MLPSGGVQQLHSRPTVRGRAAPSPKPHRFLPAAMFRVAEAGDPCVNRLHPRVCSVGVPPHGAPGKAASRTMVKGKERIHTQLR
jgi:hypothetical protein